jgi:hypothetical protein
MESTRNVLALVFHSYLMPDSPKEQSGNIKRYFNEALPVSLLVVQNLALSTMKINPERLK